jgi:vanillate O-demethylase monooxygenase subunit
VRIPGQDHIPEKARLRTYPVVEKWKWIWVWMGDPEKADEALIPNFFWLDDPAWEAVGSSIQLQARHQLLNENLLDLSHVEFVHRGSISSSNLSEHPIETKVEGQKVRISRIMKNIEAAPLFVKTMGLPDRIDRWQVEEFQPPCYHVVHVSAGSPGTRLDDSCQYKVINAIVPERPNRSRYLWSVSRNYRREEKWVSDYLQEAVQRVFMEDVAVCEAQEAMISSLPNPPTEMLAKMDTGVTSARRILAEMKLAESQETSGQSHA